MRDSREPEERQKFFTIRWEGSVLPKNIVTKITSDSLVRTAATEKWIENKWQDKVRAGLKPWPNDTKPTRFRLCGTREEHGELVVTLDPCVSYRDFAGSNSRQFLEQFGEQCNPHPLAVTAVVVTSDEKIVLTIRKNVDHKRGGFHATLGGFMDIRKESDPVSALMREIKEELDILPEEVKDVRCIAAVYVADTLHTDLVFSARTTLTSTEIDKRKKDDEEENSGLFFISATRGEIERVVRNCLYAGCEVGIAALLLLGRQMRAHDKHDSPDSWYRRTCAFLADESPQYEIPKVLRQLEERDIKGFQMMVR